MVEARWRPNGDVLSHREWSSKVPRSRITAASWIIHRCVRHRVLHVGEFSEARAFIPNQPSSEFSCVVVDLQPTSETDVSISFRRQWCSRRFLAVYGVGVGLRVWLTSALEWCSLLRHFKSNDAAFAYMKNTCILFSRQDWNHRNTMPLTANLLPVPNA